jgi:hypothetical protein
MPRRHGKGEEHFSPPRIPGLHGEDCGLSCGVHDTSWPPSARAVLGCSWEVGPDTSVGANRHLQLGDPPLHPPSGLPGLNSCGS